MPCDCAEFFQLEAGLRMRMKDYLDSLGVSGLQFFYLSYIHTHRDCKVSDIAAAARLDKASVSRALSALDRLGYIRRSVSRADSRSFVLTLTPAGQVITDGAEQARESWWQDTLSALTGAERETLGALLRRALRRAGSGAPDAAAAPGSGTAFFY